MYRPSYTPFASRCPTFSCTDALSFAVIRRFVHEHFLGMYRSTFSPSALIIVSRARVDERDRVERDRATSSARVRGPCDVSFSHFLSAGVGIAYSARERSHDGRASGAMRSHATNSPSRVERPRARRRGTPRPS